VFIPKCRKKVLYGQVRRELGPVLRELVRQKEEEVIEGHLMVDHLSELRTVHAGKGVSTKEGCPDLRRSDAQTQPNRTRSDFVTIQ
jgi:putative transposase